MSDHFHIQKERLKVIKMVHLKAIGKALKMEVDLAPKMDYLKDCCLEYRLASKKEVKMADLKDYHSEYH